MTISVTTAGNFAMGNPKKNKGKYPNGANGIAPWWAAASNPQQGMQVFAPGVMASIRESAKAIPQGLSPQDMANMTARVGAQNRTSTMNALTNAGQQMGAANPAFALSAARIRAGAGANTAAQMANVGIQETRNNQMLGMQRRDQMNDAAKLGLGYGNTLAGWMANMGRNDAASEAVKLRRDQWEEWVNRRRAYSQTQNKGFGVPNPKSGTFEEQYGG